MLKLIVAPKTALGGYISREFFFIIDSLERRFGWRQLETWELANDSRSLRTVLLDRFGSIPEVILFWERYEVFTSRARELSRLGMQIGIWADDIHWFSEAARLSRVVPFVVADKVLAAYANRLEEFYPFVRKNADLIWVPHSASADFVIPLNEKPEPAIFLSGAMTSHYPLQRQMKALYDENSLPIVFFDHPGYHCEFDHESDGRIGKGFARNIAKHLAAITDGLIYCYLVAKFFEIPATGALLLGEERMKGALACLGFRDGVHYLSVSPQNLKPRIKEALDPENRKEIDEMRRQGQQLVLERHLVEHRAKQIDEVFR
jgi:Glycosyl transferases group 1